MSDDAEPEPRVIDVDDEQTWPEPLRRRIAELAELVAGTTEYVSDLGLTEYEDSVRSATAGHQMRAYHFTRLLDHEVADVRSRGLVPLSAELIEERLDAALRVGALNADEHRALLSGNALISRADDQRANQVCLVLGRDVFQDPGAVSHLLGTWGGEAIYFTSAGLELEERLRSLGQPCIVGAALDLSDSSHLLSPGVANVVVGRMLGLPDAYADVFYRRAVEPEDVLDIWQPGHPAYDRYLDLSADALAGRLTPRVLTDEERRRAEALRRILADPEARREAERRARPPGDTAPDGA